MHVEGQVQGHPLSWVRRVNGCITANPAANIHRAASGTSHAKAATHPTSSPTAQPPLNTDRIAPRRSQSPTLPPPQKQESPPTPEQPADDAGAPHTPDQAAKEEREAPEAQVKNEALMADAEMAAPTSTATPSRRPPRTPSSPPHNALLSQESAAPQSSFHKSTHSHSPLHSTLAPKSPTTNSTSAGHELAAIKTASDPKTATHSTPQASSHQRALTQQTSISTPAHCSTSLSPQALSHRQHASTQNSLIPRKTLSLPLLPFALFAPECYFPPHGSCAPRRLGRRALAAVYGGVAGGNAYSRAERNRREQMAVDGGREKVGKRETRDGNAMDVDEERTSSERSTERREHQGESAGAEERTQVEHGTSECTMGYGTEKERDREDLAPLASLFTRRYRWGMLDALDARHSDFGALRRSVMGWRKVRSFLILLSTIVRFFSYIPCHPWFIFRHFSGSIFLHLILTRCLSPIFLWSIVLHHTGTQNVHERLSLRAVQGGVTPCCAARRQSRCSGCRRRKRWNSRDHAPLPIASPRRALGAWDIDGAGAHLSHWRRSPIPAPRINTGPGLIAYTCPATASTRSTYTSAARPGFNARIRSLSIAITPTRSGSGSVAWPWAFGELSCTSAAAECDTYDLVIIGGCCRWRCTRNIVVRARTWSEPWRTASSPGPWARDVASPPYTLPCTHASTPSFVTRFSRDGAWASRARDVASPALHIVAWPYALASAWPWRTWSHTVPFAAYACTSAQSPAPRARTTPRAEPVREPDPNPDPYGDSDDASTGPRTRHTVAFA